MTRRALLLLALVGCHGQHGVMQEMFESKYAVNDCPVNHYEDRRGGERVVRFGGAAGNHYAPRCIAVAVGQEVTFEGDFAAHPLLAGPAPALPNGWRGEIGWLPRATTSGSSITVRATRSGFFGFYCGKHDGEGMHGAIAVSAPDAGASD